MKQRMVILILTLAIASLSRAETTVVEVRRKNFPHDTKISVVVDQGSVYLRCRDNYLDNGWEKVNPGEMLSVFEKVVEWGELNKRVKTNVQKTLYIGGVMVYFSGIESGISAVGISPSRSGGVSCTVAPRHIETLVTGIKNNLENARSEDAKNKQDLFN